MGIQLLLLVCLLTYCVPLTSSFRGKLLISTWYSIKEFDVDTRNVTVLVGSGLNGVYDLTYDYDNRYVYYPRYNPHEIVRFAYPSKRITLQTIVRSLSAPTAIAIDSTNEHIYWIDYDAWRLSRCNLDGSYVTVLSNFTNPIAIRLDVTNRWMYIVERGSGILKSRFDLAQQQKIVNFTSSRVECLDIDTDENRLYWININGEMKSAKDNGSGVKIVLSTHIRRDYYGIGVIGSYIYYAQGVQLIMVTKTSGSSPTVLYNDTSVIVSIIMFNQSGRLTTPYKLLIMFADINLSKHCENFAKIYMVKLNC